ncbi:CDP-alcohol phosphatidyltransferase family protein [soil metagenome]
MTQTPERLSFREGVAALKSAQKPSRGTAAYSRLVNRPLGRLCAALGNSFGMTPNQATAVSATLSGSAIVLIFVVRPQIWLGILVAVLLAGGYVMDSVDGQLARLRGGGTKQGEWLDHTVDTFKTSLVHLAVLVSWYRFPPAESAWWLAVPLAFEVVAMVTYFGFMLMPTLRPASLAPVAASETLVTENPLRKYALLPIDYGMHCWMFVLLGWGTGFLTVYTAVFVCCAAALLLGLRKWWIELGETDALLARNA